MSENKKSALQRISDIPRRKFLDIKEKTLDFKALPTREKIAKIKEFALDNAMFIIILLAIAIIAVMQPRFLSALNYKYHFLDCGKAAIGSRYWRCYSSQRNGYFRRPCCRSYRLYFGISLADGWICK